MKRTVSVLREVPVQHCICTTERPGDHRMVEGWLIYYEDGTYGRRDR